MGYRSNITAVFYTSKEKWPVLKQYVDEHFPGEFKEYLTVQGERAYVFKLDGVKWYDGYRDVERFNAFVKNFLKFANAQGEPNWHYEFIRIGEEANDIEVYCSNSAEWVLNIFRGVDVNI